MADISIRYRGWMVGPEAATVRRETARDLQVALASRHLDFASFKDLIAILNHEYLCVKLASEATGTPAANNADGTSLALSISLVETIIETLCENMIELYSNTEYLERELQFRALLAAVTLLNAKGVHSVGYDLHIRVTRRLEKLFTNLQWEQGYSGDLTSAKFFKVQCSYLLSAIAETFARFHLAIPLAVNLASRAINLLSFGLSVAGPAIGAGPPGNLQTALSSLRAALRNIGHRPNERYQGYFTLQELSRFAVAAMTYCDVIQAIPELSGAAKERHVQAQEFVHATMETAHSLLAEHPTPDYENTVLPPSNYWQNFQAAISSGPPAFKEYYYIYGIVDCAVQAGKVSRLPAGSHPLDERLREAAVRGGEATHRWKALEYFTARSGTSDAVLKQLLSGSVGSSHARRVQVEIGDLFSGQIPIYPLPKSEPGPVGRTLSPKDWREGNFRNVGIDDKCSIRRLGPRPHLLRRALSNDRILASGISPNCEAVFMLEPKLAQVYNMPGSDSDGAARFLVQHESTREVFIQVALSDKYFVSMTRTELQVTRYATIDVGDAGPSTKEKFCSDSRESKWIPRCLAVFGDWIAIAGETSIDNVRSGSIRIYQVLATPKRLLGVSRSPAAFHKPSPDPLKGDQVTHIDFSSNGGRLVCITKNNRVLTWFLSNNLRPRNAPFIISKHYATEINVKGITSATLFQIRPGRPYVLATTWPSSQRAEYDGEWTFISPVGSAPAAVPNALDHDLFQLEDAGAIVGAAVSSEGGCAALREKNGAVHLFPLKASSRGGVRAQAGVTLAHRLAAQDDVSSCATRFRFSDEGLLELFAIDRKGRVLHKVFYGSEGLLAHSSSPRPSLVSNMTVELRPRPSTPTPSSSDRAGSSGTSRGTG